MAPATGEQRESDDGVLTADAAFRLRSTVVTSKMEESPPWSKYWKARVKLLFMASLNLAIVGFLQEFEGMLRKQGHDIMGSYSDRWCVLKRNVLTYYKKPNTPELGALPLEVSLHRCTVCHCV